MCQNQTNTLYTPTTTSKVCPHCGKCPHCGQGGGIGGFPYPNYPINCGAGINTVNTSNPVDNLTKTGTAGAITDK